MHSNLFDILLCIVNKYFGFLSDTKNEHKEQSSSAFNKVPITLLTMMSVVAVYTQWFSMHYVESSMPNIKLYEIMSKYFLCAKQSLRKLMMYNTVYLFLKSAQDVFVLYV
jgi:fumarate reductase subunit D